MRLYFSVLSKSVISGPLLHVVEHPKENIKEEHPKENIKIKKYLIINTVKLNDYKRKLLINIIDPILNMRFSLSH